jgi:hypothetical protein
MKQQLLAALTDLVCFFKPGAPWWAQAQKLLFL